MMRNFRYVLFLLALAAPGSASALAQGAARAPELTSKRLLNDLHITLASTPHLGDGMTMGLVVRYGATYDPADKWGLAHLVSRMFLKATNDRTQKDIQSEMAYLGVTIEVQCDWDGFRFILKGRSSRFERALLLLQQVVAEARFIESDFNAVKQSILKDLQKPGDSRSRLRAQLDSVLFSGTPYGRPLEGTPASLSAITLGDVRYFYRRYFSPHQASLQIVGDVSPALVLQKATRIWGIWVRVDDIPFTFKQPRVPAGRQIFLEDDPGSPAAQFIVASLFPRREDPAYANCLLAGRVFQERLTRLLPTSLVTVSSEGRRMASPFLVQGQSAANQAVDQIQKVQLAAEEMKIDPVSDEELQAAQKQVIEEFNRGLNSTDGLCNLMLDAELYHLGSNYAALFPDQVRRCDAETIKQAAKSWLFPGGEIVLMRGPTDVLKPLLETLGAVQPMPR